MPEFIALIEELDSTNSTLKKRELLRNYFGKGDRKELIWALYFLLGEKVPLKKYKRKNWQEDFCEFTGYSMEFYKENYRYVGDSAEAMALLSPKGGTWPKDGLNDFVQKILNLDSEYEQGQKRSIFSWWEEFDEKALFVIHKMLTSGFRIGVSKNLLTQSLAEEFGIELDVLQRRFMGGFDPQKTLFKDLLREESKSELAASPYPFYLASPLDKLERINSNLKEWLAEWKYDGIRVQLVKRNDDIFLWSRGGEIINNSFPDILEKALEVPGSFALDGELVIYKDEKVQDFSDLQKRLGRKTPGKKVISDGPATIMAYDLMEYDFQDIREKSLATRRDKLKDLLKDGPFLLSPALGFKTISDLEAYREQAIEEGTEGIMLKLLSGVYKSGRKRGEWWKWKIDPFSIDAVLIYAQAGSGRRSGLFTDYTFAVWDENNELVTLTKAYSGLTDKELSQMDDWIKKNTVQRFGPVRQVRPHHVFELHFEGIAESKRHASGLALRFPRIHAWRKDKVLEEANTLKDVRELLDAKKR